MTAVAVDHMREYYSLLQAVVVASFELWMVYVVWTPLEMRFVRMPLMKVHESCPVKGEIGQRQTERLTLTPNQIPIHATSKEKGGNTRLKGTEKERDKGMNKQECTTDNCLNGATV